MVMVVGPVTRSTFVDEQIVQRLHNVIMLNTMSCNV